MTATELYHQLAEAYQAQGMYQERDRFMVLALDAAHTAGQQNLAERIRLKLLELNPNHLVKPYPNTAAALQAQNFVSYLGQLRKNFPPNKAQALLAELSSSQTNRPKRTMLAEPSFPMADPVEDRQTPTWSQLNVEARVKPAPPPLPATVLLQTPNDPLANVPMNPPRPTPFAVEPPKPPPVPRRPEVVPAPPRLPVTIVESPSGLWLGNLLFVVLFLASLATLAYVFVLPFYPEVAKMVKW